MGSQLHTCLAGRPLTAFVDHKALIFALANGSKPWSPHQQRQLSFISEFTSDIWHVAGKHNLVASCLSQPAGGTVHLGEDYTQLAVDQQVDLEGQTDWTVVSSLQLPGVPFHDCGETLRVDVPARPARPIISDL